MTTNTSKPLEDLSTALLSHPAVLMVGNVHDHQPVQGPGGSTEYVTLSEGVCRVLRGGGYFPVVYDLTRRGRDASAQDGGLGPFVMAGEGTGPNADALDDLWSPGFMGRYLDSLNPALRGTTADDLSRIRGVMEDFASMAAERPGLRPYAFVVPDASRLVAVPGSPSEAEYAALQVLFKTMQTGSVCRIVLLEERDGDLPLWIESPSNNSGLRRIDVPLPDMVLREAFFMDAVHPLLENTDAFDADVLARRFSAAMGNSTLRHMLIFRDLVSSRPGGDGVRDAERLEDTLRLFLNGRSRDVWSDPSMSATLGRLGRTLRDCIKGQDRALETIAQCLRVSSSGLLTSRPDDHSPKAVFVLAGPTGTGKTETCKVLARTLLGNESALVRIDMSEYKEKGSMSKLIGAAPGYVGFDQGGQLTGKVKADPCSIVLLDEVEKADPEVFDLLLQVFSDGRLTDSHGDVVDFSKTVVVLTTNLGVTASDGVGTGRGPAGDTALDGLVYAEEERARADGLKASMVYDRLFDERFEEYGEACGALFTTSDEAFDHFVDDLVRRSVEEYFGSIGRPEIFGRIGQENVLVYNFVSGTVAREIAGKVLDAFVAKYRSVCGAELGFDGEAREFVESEASLVGIREYGGRGVTKEVENLMRPVGEAVAQLPRPVGRVTVVLDGDRLRAVVG